MKQVARGVPFAITTRVHGMATLAYESVMIRSLQMPLLASTCFLASTTNIAHVSINISRNETPNSDVGSRSRLGNGEGRQDGGNAVRISMYVLKIGSKSNHHSSQGN